MNKEDSILIVDRFFEALSLLIGNGVIRGKATFCRTYNINRMNMAQLEANHARKIFQPAWLTYMVRDFKVSPRYLLTGEGPVLAEGWSYDAVREEVRRAKKRADEK